MCGSDEADLMRMHMAHRRTPSPVCFLTRVRCGEVMAWKRCRVWNVREGARCARVCRTHPGKAAVTWTDHHDMPRGMVAYTLVHVCSCSEVLAVCVYHHNARACWMEPTHSKHTARGHARERTVWTGARVLWPALRLAHLLPSRCALRGSRSAHRPDGWPMSHRRSPRLEMGVSHCSTSVQTRASTS